MNNQAFLDAYNESRNGANQLFMHPLVRSFTYSDGVRDCAKAGLYWLLDIAATELPRKLPPGDLGILNLTASDGKGELTLSLHDDEPPVWRKKLDYTDAPDGSWNFMLVNEGERTVMILNSEY